MPYHILVIEDDADIQELIREFLTVQDYYVDVAGDGKEGIQKFMETNPDLLILDVMLPEDERISGIESHPPTIRCSRDHADGFG